MGIDKNWPTYLVTFAVLLGVIAYGRRKSIKEFFSHIFHKTTKSH